MQIRLSQLVQFLILLGAVIPCVIDMINEAVNGPMAAFLSDEHKVAVLSVTALVSAFLPRFKALVGLLGGAKPNEETKG